MTTTRRVALVLEYDGTGLCGWQRQNNGPTVQQHVEEALSTLLKRPMKVVGASRTDAGVHAMGQVCHFDTEVSIPPYGIARGVSAHLPPSIVCLEAREVDSEFHARFSARGKHYRYIALNRATRSPLSANRAWHIRAPLDVAAMSEGAQFLVGEHDFSAFRATGCAARRPVREVTEIAVTRSDDSVEIAVRGNAFLRNMVRIIAGTLVAVGRGKLTPGDVKRILESRDRTEAAQTAPAPGLTLVQVFY